MVCCRSLRAWTSCPCPMETYRVSNFSLFPSAMMESVGSEPIDRKQIRGVRGSDSSHIFSKSRITPSVYFSPIASIMYLRAWKTRGNKLGVVELFVYCVHNRKGEYLFRDGLEYFCCLGTEWMAQMIVIYWLTIFSKNCCWRSGKDNCWPVCVTE